MSGKSDGPSPPGAEDGSLAVQNSPEFAALRKALRRFVFPATVGFLCWYALYVLLSAYARGFMGLQVFGNINAGVLLGVLQFVSTFVIAWAYSRYAERHLDPKAEAIKEHMENGNAGQEAK